MKIILKYLFRNMIEKKSRSLIIVFAIAMTTLLLLFNLEIRTYFNNSYADFMRNSSGSADVVVTGNKENSNVFFQTKDVDLKSTEILHTLGLMVSTGKLEDDQGQLVKIKMVGMDEQQAIDMGVLQLNDPSVKGALSTDQSVIISEATAERWHVKVGDSLHFTYDNKEQTVKIRAIGKNRGVFFSDQPDSVVFVMQLAAVNQLYGVKDKVNTLYLNLKDDQNINATIDQLKAQNTTLTMKPVVDFTELETKMNSVYIALLFVMLVILLISVYIISSLFQVIITERIPTIGTFQSIGATKKQTSGLLLLESILYGVIGGGLGVGIGVLSLSSVLNLLNEYGSSTTVPEYSFLHIGATWIFGLVVAVLSSLFHILSIQRYSTKNIILNTVQHTDKRKWGSVLVGCVSLLAAGIIGLLNTHYELLLGLMAILLLLMGGILLSRPLAWGTSAVMNRILPRRAPGTVRLGIHNIRSNRFLHGNITLTAVALTLIITVYTVVLGVQSYMTNISTANDFDISVTNLDDDPQQYNELKQTAGVQESYQEYLLFGKLVSEGQDINGMTLIGMDKNYEFKKFHQEGVMFDPTEAKKLADGRNVIIDQFVASKYNLAIGDSVQLAFEDGSDDAVPLYKIVGLMDSSNFVTTRKGAMIGMDQLIADFGNHPFQILFKTTDDREQVKKQLEFQLAETNATVRTLDQIINNSMQGVDGLFMALNLFIALSIILAGFGIVNNLLVSFLQRQREIAVLYSVCMSRGQLRMLFVIEIAGVFLLSSILAVVLSYFISLLLPGFLWGAGIAFQFAYPWQFISGILGAMLIVFAIITLVPIIKFSRMNVVTQLKYD